MKTYEQEREVTERRLKAGELGIELARSIRMADDDELAICYEEQAQAVLDALEGK